MLQPRTKGRFFSLLLTHGCRVLLLLFCLATPVFSVPEKSDGTLVFRDHVPLQHRSTLANKLRKITGWPQLSFNTDGSLQIGQSNPVGGSESARDLLLKVIKGPNFVVIEDANHRTDVVFCKVVLAKWKNNRGDNPPAYVVLIDFADFDQVMGDRRALESFNAGWGLLHELEHVVNDSADAEQLEETGECEVFINKMRRECGLPERAEYFFTFLPLSANSDFKTRFVRLSFLEERSSKKQKRYWIIWDADIVGGIKSDQIASLRP